MTTREYTPFLVQRIERRSSLREDKKGLDQHFGFSYMGSAEFEFGALGKSLKAFRACQDDIVVRKITFGANFVKGAPDVGQFTIWYVGREVQKEEAATFFLGALNEDMKQRQRLKERSELADAYGIGRWVMDSRTTGWWNIDERRGGNAPWALFKNEADAKLWRKSL